MTTKLRCAVVGCILPGVAHPCPYDGTFHGHGRIHYETGKQDAAAEGFAFHADAWDYVCDGHYTILVAALDARRVSGATPKEGR